MKNLLKNIFLPLCICFLCASCASDDFAGVEESASFDELGTYFDQINEFNPIALKAMEGVTFENGFVSSATSENCDGSTTTTAATGSLQGGAAHAMQIFSETLGFESNMALNRWFIDFGKVYYDLVVENKPDDKEEFISYVTSQHNLSANTCTLGCLQRMSLSAYNVGKRFGVRTNIGSNTQSANDIYGTTSPIYYVHTMMEANTGCQGSE